MLTTQASLVMLGLNTKTPQVFFNGVPVPDVTEIKVDWEHDEQRVKLRVAGDDDTIYMQLVDAGISVRKVQK